MSNCCVGVVGIGRMGKPITRHLSRARFDVCFYDVNPKARVIGAQRMNSCKELTARADVILVIVGTDSQVKDCFTGKEGLLGGPASGKIFVIIGTIHPRTLKAVRTAVKGKGGKVLDAPVVWGEKGAEKGQLVSYVCGDRDSFEKSKKIFSAYSKEVFYLGPSGSGLIAKTANNHLMWTCRFANFEVLLLARHYYRGDLRTLYRALLAGTGSNRCLERLSGVGGDIPWVDKDIGIVLNMSRHKSFQPLFARAVKRSLKNRKLIEFNQKGLKWLERRN